MFQVFWACLWAGVGFRIFLAVGDVDSAGGILVGTDDRHRWCLVVYGVPGGLADVQGCRAWVGNWLGRAIYFGLERVGDDADEGWG